MKLLDCPFPELLGEPQKEPEYAWLIPASGSSESFGAWCDRQEGKLLALFDSLEAARAHYGEPVQVTVADALAWCRASGGRAVILLDASLNELRRWDLRGHRGEGS